MVGQRSGQLLPALGGGNSGSVCCWLRALEQHPGLAHTPCAQGLCSPPAPCQGGGHCLVRDWG